MKKGKGHIGGERCEFGWFIWIALNWWCGICRKHGFANASIWYIDINTTFTRTVGTIGAILNPNYLYMASVVVYLLTEDDGLRQGRKALKEKALLIDIKGFFVFTHFIEMFTMDVLFHHLVWYRLVPELFNMIGNMSVCQRLESDLKPLPNCC